MTVEQRNFTVEEAASGDCYVQLYRHNIALNLLLVFIKFCMIAKWNKIQMLRNQKRSKIYVQGKIVKQTRKYYLQRQCAQVRFALDDFHKKNLDLMLNA